MPIATRLPQTPEEYLRLVGDLSALIDVAFVRAESAAGAGRAHELASRLPVLISLVNTLSTLRGDNDAFADVRPRPHAEGQADLYKLEEAFMLRLQNLVGEVEAVGEAKYFQSEMRRHYYQLKD